MRFLVYSLIGHDPIGFENPTEWGEAWSLLVQRRGHIVAQDHVGDTFVSTVFLGVDHSMRLTEPPILFETAVFDNAAGVKVVERYATWDEAAAAHEDTVAKMRARLARSGD